MKGSYLSNYSNLYYYRKLSCNNIQSLYMRFNNKTKLTFSATANNTGGLEHVISHDYSIQKIYVKQPLEGRSLVAAVTALFIYEYMSSPAHGGGGTETVTLVNKQIGNETYLYHTSCQKCSLLLSGKCSRQYQYHHYWR